MRRGLLNKLDERLSIIVTDKASTSAITFSEVMDKLADDMHVDKLTLFQRWWDTANEIPDGAQRTSAPPMYSAIPKPSVGAAIYRKSTVFLINAQEQKETKRLSIHSKTKHAPLAK